MGNCSASARVGHANKRASKFQRYDQRRFAIVWYTGKRKELLFGTAHFERDDSIGNILRFSLELNMPGNPEIIVTEKDWNGLITDGQHYGCDYCMMVSYP